MTTFSVFSFGHNLNLIRYPYLASIQSALVLTRKLNKGNGAAYFAICSCSDGTEDDIRDRFKHEIASGELKLIQHDWRDHHHVQVEICNHLLDEIGTNQSYAMKLDADEVLHQDSFDNFETDLMRMNHFGMVLGNPHYTHLLDPKRDFDFIYRDRAVIVQTKSGLRFEDNDACAIGGHQEFKTRLEVFHFGKWSPGREREALFKEITFTKGYADLGFPDPRVVAQLNQGYLNYDAVFENAKQHGEVREWHGTYPVFAEGWVKESLERSEQFKRDLTDGKIGPLETEHWWEK